MKGCVVKPDKFRKYAPVLKKDLGAVEEAIEFGALIFEAMFVRRRIEPLESETAPMKYVLRWDNKEVDTDDGDSIIQLRWAGDQPTSDPLI